MQLVFLGTSSGAPTRDRNVTSVALRTPHGPLWLFDCGEGTQHRLMAAPVRRGRLRRVFVSHMHGDHVLGLPGLLGSLSLTGGVAELDVHGPAPLAGYLDSVATATDMHLSFRLGVHPVAPGELLRDGPLTVTCAPLRHRVPSFGYRVQEAPRRGRFDPERAAALGVPRGPAFGRLAAGEPWTDGVHAVSPDQVCGPLQPGRSVVICTDTTYCPASVELARGADLLVHECTFGDDERPLAEQQLHATARDAARVAAEAGVGRLVLTHFSARYGPDGVAALVEQARSVFPQVDAAEDFMVVDV